MNALFAYESADVAVLLAVLARAKAALAYTEAAG